MMQVVLFVCLSIVIITVSSNPVAQVLPAQQCSVCQQNPYNNLVTLPAAYQPAATQTSPYPHPTTVQNPTPTHSGFEGTINQLLMSKILEIPGLQKILDPNTKIFNQNGHEIQRHPNTGATPSVVNNYFIVPPDFFSLNDTTVKSNNVLKRKRNNSNRKGNQIKTIAKTNEKDNDGNKLTNNEPINRRKNVGRTKNRGRKQKQGKSPAKIAEEHIEINNEDGDDLRPVVKKTKRGKKQGRKTKQAKLTAPPPFENSENGSENKVDGNKDDQKTRKRPRKTKSKVTEEVIPEGPMDIEDTEVAKGKAAKRKKKHKDLAKTEDMAQLKNIESPVDNQETIKDLTENRKTRNSKNNASNNEDKPTQKIAPVTDDVMKMLFPYMYPGNYFYPNAFNFEQFYQPNFGTSNKKNKKRKNKTNQNEEKKDSLPKVVNVQLKPKKQEATTTINPISEEITGVSEDASSTEISTKTSEPVTDISMELPHRVAPKQESDESPTETEPVIPKPEYATNKAKMEMPPTVIEDLHEFLNLELGKESIVPTIHTNGIISDYYPMFDDDSYYASDENYYLKDLEDERHYYTTDRSHEELINRERRKYDSYDKTRNPNLDTKDRLYCRRGFICKEIDKVKDVDEIDKNSIHYTHAKMKAQKNTDANENKELPFHTPPLLENPDFRTKKIEKEHYKNSEDLNQPIYRSDSAERVSDIPNIYSEMESPEFDRHVNIESEIRKEKGLPKTTRPSNDHIETVFAKTRVVKYGVDKDKSEEDTSVSSPVQDDHGDVNDHGDHTTYVIAKSLGQVDDYYWK